MNKAVRAAQTRVLTAGQELARILTALAEARELQERAVRAKLPQVAESLAVQSADKQQAATVVMTVPELERLAKDLQTLYEFATDVANGKVELDTPPNFDPSLN